MLGFGKKKEKEYLEFKGKVARIGSVGSGEYVQRYVILLQGDTHAYVSRLENVTGGMDVVALTQPGDLVEFKTEKGYLSIEPKTFVNRTLAEQGYTPQT